MKRASIKAIALCLDAIEAEVLGTEFQKEVFIITARIRAILLTN